jgi:hypothetical protein
MWWKNLGLPGQSMTFGMAVALTVMLLKLAIGLLSLYLTGGQYSDARCNAAAAQVAARNHLRCEPDDVFAPRPGSRGDYDAGRGLPGKGR